MKMAAKKGKPIIKKADIPCVNCGEAISKNNGRWTHDRTFEKNCYLYATPPYEVERRKP